MSSLSGRVDRFSTLFYSMQDDLNGTFVKSKNVLVGNFIFLLEILL